jgi:hypothetical protein
MLWKIRKSDLLNFCKILSDDASGVKLTFLHQLSCTWPSWRHSNVKVCDWRYSTVTIDGLHFFETTWHSLIMVITLQTPILRRRSYYQGTPLSLVAAATGRTWRKYLIRMTMVRHHVEISAWAFMELSHTFLWSKRNLNWNSACIY